MTFYQKNISDIYQELATNSTTGLTSEQAQQFLLKYGKNELQAKKSSSIFYIFFLQFADPLTYMLFGAAAIIFFADKPLDAMIIIGILLFNAIVGTIQEKRIEKVLDGLQLLFTCDSLIIRDKKQQIISSSLIVPGDLIILSAGDKIPADARIISATNLTTDESTLTGESTLSEKNSEQISQNDVELSQQSNILFAGTYVVTGHAKAIIFATGKKTLAGNIHGSMEKINTDTPLKRDLAILSYWILIFIGIMCTSLFIIGLLTEKPMVDLLVMITALFICVIPEGLPIVLMIICVSGAYKMAQKNVLVKQLKAIETLGRIDLIITDKTGTLTNNAMMVNNVFVDGEMLEVSGTSYFIKGSVKNQEVHQASLDKIAIACALINDTQIEFDQKLKLFKIIGNPTQAASFIFAQKINQKITEIAQDYKIIHFSPFDLTTKYSAVFCEKNGSNVAFIFGAPDIILPACQNNPDVQKALDYYLTQGSRVLTVAQKTYTQTIKEDSLCYHDFLTFDLEFLGLLAMNDEPRENINDAINQINKANIQIIMATGDHQQTAAFIAKKIGIVHDDTNMILGLDFEKLTDIQAFNLMNNKNFVCARFLPQDKLRLVQLFRNQGMVVAMIGDGINDVPALIASDVSIAMGTIGSQLTKQSADIVLMNDSFENIIHAIQQGRDIFHAVRRTLLYFLTSNAGEVFIIFFALACSIPLPLLPSQILLLNLITDGFLDAALAMEPINYTSTQLAPKTVSTVFDRTIIYKTLYLALPVSLISLATFLSIYKTDLELARTLTFVTMIMLQYANALNCRSEKKSIFHIGLFSNYWFNIATIIIFLLQIIIVYTPILQYIFKTVPLSLNHWVYAVVISSSVLIVEEMRKYLVQRFYISSN